MWIFTKKCILLLSSTIFKVILTVCLKEVAEEAPDDPSDEDFVGVEVVVTEGLCKDLIKSSNRSSASSGKKRKFFVSQIQYSLL